MVQTEYTPGSVVSDRYHILRKIGAGASATVYLAEDEMMHRQIALKILSPDPANSDLKLHNRAFINEVQAIQELGKDHNPHIVEIVDVSMKEGEKYIVMEYVNGTTLRAHMDQKKVLSVNEILSCTGQILAALHTAHHRGIIHRDIKPQNVMITQEGRLKVTDFGIAKLANIDRFELKNRAIGTVSYISPEQVSGQAVDERSDIYSLGVMMYEMATGHLPFEGNTAQVIADKHMTEKPIPPCSYRQDLPIGLEQIILCALEKDPSDRFQSAGDMRSAINQIVKDRDFHFNGSPAEFSEVKIKPATGLTAIFRTHSYNKDRESSSPQKKVTLIAGISAACLVLVVLAVSLIIVLTSQNAKIEMPNYVDKIYSEDFLQKIYDDGLTVEKIVYKYSDKEKGVILEQNVSRGTEVSKGSSVILTVSLGRNVPESIPLNLTGDFTAAKNALEVKMDEIYGKGQWKIDYRVTYIIQEDGIANSILSFQNWDTKKQEVSQNCTLEFKVVFDTAHVEKLIGKPLQEAKEALSVWGITPEVNPQGTTSGKVTGYNIYKNMLVLNVSSEG